MNQITSPTSPSAVCCGSSGCQCAPLKTTDASAAVQALLKPASINGIALHAAGQLPDAHLLRELAYTELLRQQALRLALLPRHHGSDALVAPELSETERQVLQAMVERAVITPQPCAEEGPRYHAAHLLQFVVGQALHVRHILFAVTPGINVQALAVHAERALLELTHHSVCADRFAALAAELSNCPSSSQGGDLGWITPEDCAPELATELFHQAHATGGTGVQPRLFHTRFGLHIIDVLQRRSGRQLAYEDVAARIDALLTLQSRGRALHQYMSVLAGQALVEGVELDTADSPLLQ
jgi:peptidyl-prolyl cis-trans isomerase C